MSKLKVKKINWKKWKKHLSFITPQFIISVCAIIISIIAIRTSVKISKEAASLNLQLFKETVEMNSENIRHSAKPMLNIFAAFSGNRDYVDVYLKNSGFGPARISNIEYCIDTIIRNDLLRLFVDYEYYKNEKMFIYSKSKHLELKMTIIKANEDALKFKLYFKPEYFDEVKEIFKIISINIDYSDIFNNTYEQPLFGLKYTDLERNE